MCNNKEDKNQEPKELNLEDLEQVTGGGDFDNVPRVPNKKIDDDLRNNA